MTKPRIKIPLTKIDWALETIAALLGTALIVTTIMGYMTMPETIPTHFNSSGEVDKFGSRESIWIISLFTIGIYAGLTIFEQFPHKFNYMVEIREANAERQYRNMLYMMRVVKVFIMVLFFFTTYVINQIASSNAQSMNRWFLPVIMFGLLGTVIFFIYRSYQLK